MIEGFERGFRSVEEEYAGHRLQVDGELPRWLDGALYRNGPGRFEVGDGRVEHWFDGLAMLSRYGFDDGAVSYTNRFLRSREYHVVVDEGRFDGGQFGTVSDGLLGALRRLLLPAPTDNANVNVHRLGDRLVAITETQVGVAFDPRTLQTQGEVTFDGLAGQTMTAHPHVDPRTGETVTFTTSFGRHSQYGFYRRQPGTSGFQPLGAVPTDRPSYVHTFGLTREFLVLFEFPLSVHPLRLLVPGSASFIERFRWQPERGTRIVVLDRERGERVIEHQAPPTFAFHHVNAFEHEDLLHVDIAAFDGPDVINALYLDELRAGGFPDLDGALRRYRVPTAPGEVSVETLHPEAVTLPRIDPRQNTRRYRFAYAQGPPDPDRGAPHRLVKVDTQQRSAKQWFEPGTFCGEPVFVPRPGAGREDAGVVLSVVLEAPDDRSSLLVLDARTFEELARAPLPHVTPFDFHGQYEPGGRTDGDV